MPTAPAAPVLHLSMRATRDVPALDLLAGDSLLLSLDPAGPITMARDGCQPVGVSPDELRSLDAASRDGALVYAAPPSDAELLGFFDAKVEGLAARLAEEG